MLKLSPTEILIDPTNLEYELLSGDIDELVDAIFGPSTSVFQASVSVESTNAVFEGDVLDAITDPPFTINASGSFSGIASSATDIAEPSTGLLFIGSLAFLAMRRRLQTV